MVTGSVLVMAPSTMVKVMFWLKPLTAVGFATPVRLTTLVMVRQPGVKVLVTSAVAQVVPDTTDTSPRPLVAAQ